MHCIALIVVTVEQINRYPIPDAELMRLRAGIQSAGPLKPTAFILGQGLWNNLEVGESTAWLDSVLSVIHRRSTSQAPPTLLVTPNAAGKEKEDEWLVSQGNKALVRFEESMAIAARDRGIEHLGTWNMVSISRTPSSWPLCGRVTACHSMCNNMRANGRRLARHGILAIES